MNTTRSEAVDWPYDENRRQDHAELGKERLQNTLEALRRLDDAAPNLYRDVDFLARELGVYQWWKNERKD